MSTDATGPPAPKTSVAPPYGSRLLGSERQPGIVLRIRLQVLLTLSIVAANLVGTLALVAILAWVVPIRGDLSREVIIVNAIAVPVYVLVAVVIGIVWGTARVVRRVRWAIDGREPTDAERRAALRAPLELVRVQSILWVVALVLFTTLNGILDPDLILGVSMTITLVGLVTCADTYLVSEFLLRPVAAAALTARPPEQLLVPGVRARTLLAWAVGSAVPVVGLMLIAAFALVQQDVSATRMAVAILVLGALTLVLGLYLELMAVRATLDPIRGLRDAMRAIERGALDTEVAVYDGTEVGLLQVGFNRMAAGLRERERIRDLFGRHVGEDVARAALASGVELGGEIRYAAVVFVDIIGSTQLAARRPPQEVVGLLNRFFSVVVDVVTDLGGLVNKFEGDAALAVFGAPAALDDAADRALACARCLAKRLGREVPECPAGIGVAAGLSSRATSVQSNGSSTQ
ncbi:MAG: HAMP domain-containing protein [Acidimicrobiales bacterium]|nr:HAMP domain-containing protein [Acidimicrobiales bacterium]